MKTFHLLFGDSLVVDDSAKVSVTEEIAEWDHGEYEGLLSSEIRKRRAEKGLDREKPWSMYTAFLATFAVQWPCHSNCPT